MAFASRNGENINENINEVQEMADFDLHIRNGTIVDGTRAPRFRGDLWIKDGRIAQIGGRASGSVEQEIDATGHIVAPGFIDLHTHYDGQIRWDPYCTGSGWHGVTTVAFGNCGFGFAPVQPEFRERAMLSMTRNEAIPLPALQEGMPWDWETIPEFLDSFDRTPKGVNCATYLPMGPLMIYVMGLEAAKTREATPSEREEMRRLLHEGMDAGCLGFSFQRLGPNSAQADFDGSPNVTDTMSDEEVFNLARVLRERDEGTIQVLNAENGGGSEPRPGGRSSDREFQEELAAISGRPILYNFVPVNPVKPDFHVEIMEWIAECNRKGLRMYGHGFTVRSGYGIILDGWNLYDVSPAWRELTTGTFDEQMRKVADPKLREWLRREQDENPDLAQGQLAAGGPPHQLRVRSTGGNDELEKYVGKSIGRIAKEEGKHIIDVMLDLSMAGNLQVEFVQPEFPHNPEYSAALYNDSPYIIPGLSDGGAHTKFISFASWTTDMLAWLVRDEKTMTLEEAHYRLSALPAHVMGFRDRGVLREGAAADIVVYDLDRLDIEPRWVGNIEHDLPAGEWRRNQRAIGYKSIIVNGQVTFEDGECTGATPGALLRQGAASHEP